jgi:hypothetical protein
MLGICSLAFDPHACCTLLKPFAPAFYTYFEELIYAIISATGYALLFFLVTMWAARQ